MEHRAGNETTAHSKLGAENTWMCFTGAAPPCGQLWPGQKPWPLCLHCLFLEEWRVKIPEKCLAGGKVQEEGGSVEPIFKTPLSRGGALLSGHPFAWDRSGTTKKPKTWCFWNQHVVRSQKIIICHPFDENSFSIVFARKWPKSRSLTEVPPFVAPSLPKAQGALTTSLPRPLLESWSNVPTAFTDSPRG